MRAWQGSPASLPRISQSAMSTAADDLGSELGFAGDLFLGAEV